MKDHPVMARFHAEKITHLLLSLGIDLVGMFSYLIPVLGESSDFAYAPLQAFAIFLIYQKAGMVPRMLGGAVGFAEEILPGTDFVPTATLMWFYTYSIKKESTLQKVANNIKKENDILNQ